MPGVYPAPIPQPPTVVQPQIVEAQQLAPSHQHLVTGIITTWGETATLPEEYFPYQIHGTPSAIQGTVGQPRAPTGSGYLYYSVHPQGAGFYKGGVRGDPWKEYYAEHGTPVPAVSSQIQQISSAAEAQYQARLYQVQTGGLREFRGMFSEYGQRYAAAPIGTPIPSLRQYEQIKYLQSPTAQWASEQAFRQAATPLSRYGEFAGVSGFRGTIVSPAPIPSLKPMPTMGEYLSRQGAPLPTGISLQRLPSTPIDYKITPAEQYWGKLTPFQKGVGLVGGTLVDVTSVAGSFIQSRFRAGESGYQQRIYELAPRGERKTLAGAGQFAIRGLTGEVSMTGLSAYGLGYGLRVLKLAPSVLKGLGYGATGLQAYESGKAIYEGEYGKAITGAGIFVASMPFVSAGYATKIPMAKMFGTSEAVRQKAVFGGQRYYAEPEISVKAPEKPVLYKMFGGEPAAPSQKTPLLTKATRDIIPQFKYFLREESAAFRQRTAAPLRTEQITEKRGITNLWKSVEPIPIEKARPELYEKQISAAFQTRLGQQMKYPGVQIAPRAPVPGRIFKAPTGQTPTISRYMAIAQQIKGQVPSKRVSVTKTESVLKPGLVQFGRQKEAQIQAPTQISRQIQSQMPTQIQTQMQRQMQVSTTIQALKPLQIQTPKAVSISTQISKPLQIQTAKARTVRPEYRYTPERVREPPIKPIKIKFPAPSTDVFRFRRKGKRGRKGFRFPELAPVAAPKQLMRRASWRL